MRWRDISEEEVVKVVEAVEDIQDSIKGRKKVSGRVGEKLIKVIFKEEAERIVIISAIDKTR